MPPDSEPGPPPSLPGIGLWSDSDVADVGIGSAPESRSTRTESLPPEPSTTIGHIGRYALKSLIGEGGLGTVYAAQDPLLSRTIAIKTLNLQVAAEDREAFNALFLNEARAAGGLSHPNIVTVFDAGISDNRAYIAMELLKGKDLRQLRQEGWRPTPAQAALIARRVADALAYAHSKGVIHCDVKPANIFMVGRTQPRVLDFGIARLAHRKEAGGAGALAAGSPYYMAPEQIRNESIDRRADVFSLGVVLYEMLADEKPFRGSSLEEITEAVLTRRPPLASDLEPGVPRALAEITARAMEKDPALRWRSARSLSRELRHWLEEQALGGEATTGAATGTPERRWWLAAGLAAGAVAGGAAIWALLARPDTAPASTASATPAASATAAAAPPDAASAAPATSVPAALLANAANGDVPSVAAAPAAAAPAAPAKVAATTTPKTAATTPPPAARERRGRDAKAATPPVAPAPAFGLVRLAISPWGQVEVDGAPAGSAPPLAELNLTEGRHQVTIRNADFPPFTTTVTVSAGQPVTLKHRFGP